MVDCGRSGAVLRRGRVSVLCALLVLGGVSLFRHDVSTLPVSSRLSPVASTALIARLPLAFEPNVGQVAQPVRFLARGSGYGLFLTPSEAVLSLPARRGTKNSRPVAMQFAGANPSVALEGTQTLPGHSNYFIGNDPSRWLHDVSHFSRVRYSSLYSGIDLDFYGREGRLEYDFEVAPGADPRQIELQFQGTDALQIAKNGDLVLAVAGRELRFQAPHVYQKSGNREEEVAGSFILTANGRAAFQIGDYDRSRALVIDPVLSFSTYLGGSGDESCSVITGALSGFVPHCPAVTVDSASRVYVAGATTSTAGWPTPASAATFPPLGGASDVFVARISNTGSTLSLDYLTFIGGTGIDYPTGLGVDSGFNVYVAGNTTSSDFPTINGLQDTASGNHAFVTKLDPTGSANFYSTYLSGTAGTGTDTVSDMTVDNQAHVYVFGVTTSTDFPTTPGALQGQYKTGALKQFFFTKLDPAQSGANSLLYSTFFGGSSPSTGSVVGGAIAVDSTLNVYLAGGTSFTDMPVVNAFQGTLKQTTPPTTDVWAAKLKAPATNTQQYSLIYETYLGGTGDDVAYGVATDGTSTFLTGSTTSTDIAIPAGTTAFQSTNGGLQDAFVAKFGVPTTTGTTQGSVPLNYFTYLGGSGTDVGLAITADSTQNARVTGFTQSGSALDTNPLPNVSGGGTDAFFARISTTAGISSSTSILGGSGADIGTSLATDVTLNSFVAGETKSGNFPTAASPGQPIITPIQSGLSGNSDAFISKLGSSTTGLSLTCPIGASINGVTINACNPGGASVTPSPVGVGNQVKFTYPIYNTSDPVTGGVFTSTVQGTNSTISSLPSAGSGTCTNTTTTATCNLGTVNTSSSTTSGSTTTLASSTTVTVTVTAGAPTTPLGATSSIGNSGVLNIAGTSFQSTTSLTALVNDFIVQATPASQTVTAGNQATYTITVTPTGVIGQSVSLGSCSGLPAGASCTFSNNPIANLNSGAQNRTLQITTTPRVTTPASLFRSGKILYAFWFPVSGLALIGVGATRRRRWLAGLFIVCALGAMVLQAGCGSKSGNSSSTTGTPAGTYTVTMNATSGTATRSTAVTLVVK
jgi:Beta-propeller repeat